MCGLVISAVLLLIGVVYVAQGLHGVADLSRAKRRAQADLTAALPAAKEQSVRDRDEARTVTFEKWGRPSSAWQELTCNLDTVDAGWIVQKYTQSCRIQSVDLFATSTTGVAGASGAAPADGVAGGGCDYSSLSILFPDDPLAGQVPWTTVESGPASSLGAEDPLAQGCPDDVLSASVAGESRLVQGARPSSLDESPEWVVVTVSTDVSVSDLGCNPWGVLFCTSPVDDPVIGDLD